MAAESQHPGYAPLHSVATRWIDLISVQVVYPGADACEGHRDPRGQRQRVSQGYVFQGPWLQDLPEIGLELGYTPALLERSQYYENVRLCVLCLSQSLTLCDS